MKVHVYRIYSKQYLVHTSTAHLCFLAPTLFPFPRQSKPNSTAFAHNFSTFLRSRIHGHKYVHNLYLL
jgi:hypothetical protein